LLHRIRIRNRSGRRLLIAGASVACLIGTALAPATASATTVNNGVYCDEAVYQAFAAFGDDNLYALAPGGDFEGDLSGWTLSDGAATVDGSDPFDVTGADGSYSLQIPAGGQAVSAPVCVDPSRETFRFVVRSSSKSARLHVEALFVKDGSSRPSIVNVGYVSSQSGKWEPTPILRNSASRYLAGGGRVTYRFTADNGSVQMDDLHIDPRRIR
jgi:hypothetical protein